MNKTPEKVAYFDTIRVFAIVAVVVTHVVMGVHHLIVPSDWLAWWTINIYTVFARSAVPLFIMVSGALLLDKRRTENAATFARKRILRVLVPFVLWSMIYLLLRKFVQHEEIPWPDFFIKMIVAPVYLHLWFVYTLLGIYFLTPILRVLIRHLDRSAIGYLLIAWFVVFAVCPFFAEVFQFETSLRFPSLLGYVGYFVLGFYLHSHKIFSDARKSLLMAVVIGLATCWLNAWSPETRELWNGFLSPNIVLMSVFVFCCFQSSQFFLSRNAVVNRCVSTLGSYSFGIYFIHMIVLEALASGKLSFTFNALIFHPLLAIPLVATVTLLISLTLLWMMRKIPIVKLLAP